MAHQPDDLTVEAIRAAAKEFARHVNSQGLQELTHLFPPSYAIVKAFRRFVADQFHLPTTGPLAPPASEEERPTIGVMVLAAQDRLPTASIRYQNAQQLVYGVGQPVLLFLFHSAYSSRDAGYTVTITHALFFQPEETGDRQVAQEIHEVLNGTGDLDTKTAELVGLFVSLRPKLTRAEREDLAALVLQRPPAVGGLRYGSLRWRVQIPPTQMEDFDLLSTAERAAEHAADASAPQESAAHETEQDADQRDAAPSE
jgi:hypothetical protein